MGSLGRCLARSLLRGQPGLSCPPRAPLLRLRPPGAAGADPGAGEAGRGAAALGGKRHPTLRAPRLQAGGHETAPDQGLLDKHYQHLRQKPFYPVLLEYMTSGPVVAMVWEGYNVVRSTRTMVGDTDSAKASAGTIRGDFSMHVSRNVVHASDSVETAQREIGFWFQRNELVAWESGDRNYTYGP